MVGKANSGKSTFLNQLLGTKLSIVTSKAQTTRHRVRGVLSLQHAQLIVIDTPGILNVGIVIWSNYRHLLVVSIVRVKQQ